MIDRIRGRWDGDGLVLSNSEFAEDLPLRGDVCYHSIIFFSKQNFVFVFIFYFSVFIRHL